MRPFLDEDFMLESDTAQRLFHEHAEKMPIIDYHCHLNPALIAQDYQFENLSQIWLDGDHYKWRAMRANGIDERYCAAKETSDWERFEKWAETVPFTMRNPLYHWTHLELKQGFGIEKILNPSTAKEIYQECNQKLSTPEYSARGLMRRFNVEVVCTTDDPIDSLEYHLSLQKEGFGIKVLPTWRPDKAMAVESKDAYQKYIDQLSDVSQIDISAFDHLLAALQKRHEFFHQTGCRLSDHGTEEFYATDYTMPEIQNIFQKVLLKKDLTVEEILQFKTCMMEQFARMDHEKGWTQQLHYGPIRDNNTRLFEKYGVDIGFDSIGDANVAKNLSKFLNRLDYEQKLPPTILYNINPKDNEMIATMMGNFQDGSMPGKMQFGSGWWFLDQEEGMKRQLNTLSVLGLLSRFVGMLTDSRSFLSYPRHDYFRRILCNLIGDDIEKGKLPASEFDFIAKMVENISYYNAKEYLKI